MAKRRGAYKNNYDEFGYVFEEKNEDNDIENEGEELEASDTEAMDYDNSNSSGVFENINEELSNDEELIEGFKNIKKNLEENHFEDKELKDLLRCSSGKKYNSKKIKKNEPVLESVYYTPITTTEDVDNELRSKIASILEKNKPASKAIPNDSNKQNKNNKAIVRPCLAESKPFLKDEYLIKNPAMTGYFSCMPTAVAQCIFPYHMALRNTSVETNQAKMLLTIVNPLSSYIINKINYSVPVLINASINRTKITNEQNLYHIKNMYQAAIIAFILEKQNLVKAKTFVAIENDIVAKQGLKNHEFLIIKRLQFLLIDILSKK